MHFEKKHQNIKFYEKKIAQHILYVHIWVWVCFYYKDKVGGGGVEYNL